MKRLFLFKLAFLFILSSAIIFPVKAEATIPVLESNEQHVVSVELPSTHIPFADEQQTVDIKVDELRDEMEAQEEGSFDKIFTNFTDAAFFTADGDQLIVPNMRVVIKISADGTFISLKVPAGTEIKRGVYYFGKRDVETNQIEDLRKKGYELYMTLSAGNSDLLPYINIEPNKDESQVINVEMDGFREALGENYSSVFMEDAKYFLVKDGVENNPDNPLPAEEVKQKGISLEYSEAGGLVLTAEPDTDVVPGKYYLVWDMETEYIDFRWYGVDNAYINLTSDVTECTVQDIVITSYTSYTDISQDGLAADLKDKIGQETFDKIFVPTRAVSYCFVDVETEEVYPLFLIYPDTEFVVQVSEENVDINNRKVYVALYDWNTESYVNISVKIYTNLTVRKAVEIIDGELPSTTVDSGEKDVTVEISTEDMKFGWDFVDPGYWTAVFQDGASYKLFTDDKADLGLTLVYSEDKQVLEMNVPANSVLEKGIYFLATGEGVDLRDLGYTVSIELEIRQGSSIEEQSAENTIVLPVDGGIYIKDCSSSVGVYDLSGVLVAESFVTSSFRFDLANGIYLVKVENKVYKVIVE